MTGLFWFFGAEPNFWPFMAMEFGLELMVSWHELFSPSTWCWWWWLNRHEIQICRPGIFYFSLISSNFFRGQQEGKMKRRHMRCLQLILTDPKKEVSDWLCLQPCFEGRNNRAAAGPLMLRLSHSLRRRLTAATASLLSNRLFSLFSSLSLSRFFFRDN